MGLHRHRLGDLTEGLLPPAKEKRVRGPDSYGEHNRPLTTWLPTEDFEAFSAIARSHGLTNAQYLRAVCVDVLDEERSKVVSLLSIHLKSAGA